MAVGIGAEVFLTAVKRRGFDTNIDLIAQKAMQFFFLNDDKRNICLGWFIHI